MIKNPEDMTPEELEAELGVEGTSIALRDPNEMSDAELEAELAQGYGPTETFFGNALDNLTLDHAPEIIAWTKNGFDSDSPEYIEDRDSHRAMLEKGKVDHPVARWTGGAAGLLGPVAATAVIPEVTIPAFLSKAGQAISGTKAAVQAANVASKVPTAAKFAAGNIALGTAMNYAQNPGNTPGVVPESQHEERMKNVTDPLNVGLNVLLGSGAGLVQSKLKNMARNKHDYSFNALEPGPDDIRNNKIKVGGAPQAAIPGQKEMFFKAPRKRLESDETKAQKIGKTLHNLGLFKGNPTVQQLDDKISMKMEEIGTKISDMFTKFDGAIEKNGDALAYTAFDSEDLSENLRRTFKGHGNSAKKISLEIKAIHDDVMNYADQSKKGFLGDLHEIRQRIQSLVNYKAQGQDSKQIVENEMRNQAANYFNDYIESTVENNKKVFGDKAAQELRVIMSQYHRLSEAATIASKSSSRAKVADSSKNFFERLIVPITTGTAAGVYSGNPLVGVGAGALAYNTQKLANRANSTAARIANSPATPLVKNSLGAAVPMGINAGFQDPAMLPPPPLSPVQMDKQIKADPSLSNTQKAKMRDEIRKQNR